MPGWLIFEALPEVESMPEFIGLPNPKSERAKFNTNTSIKPQHLTFQQNSVLKSASAPSAFTSLFGIYGRYSVKGLATQQAHAHRATTSAPRSSMILELLLFTTLESLKSAFRFLLLGSG